MARDDGMVEVRGHGGLSYVVVAVEPGRLREWLDTANTVMAARAPTSATVETQFDTPFLEEDPYERYSEYMWLVRTVGGRNPGAVLVISDASRIERVMMPLTAVRFAAVRKALLAAATLARKLDRYDTETIATDSTDFFYEFNVTKPAVPLDTGVVPDFPAALRDANFGGRVVLQFIVDAKGIPEPATVYVVESAHELFAAAARALVPKLRYQPAEAGNRRVRQQVRREFTFLPPPK